MIKNKVYIKKLVTRHQSFRIYDQNQKLNFAQRSMEKSRVCMFKIIDQKRSLQKQSGNKTISFARLRSKSKTKIAHKSMMMNVGPSPLRSKLKIKFAQRKL